jgi:hypothetical protein
MWCAQARKIGERLAEVAAEPGETPQHCVARLALRHVNSHAFFKNGQGTWDFGIRRTHESLLKDDLIPAVLYSAADIEGKNVIRTRADPAFETRLATPLVPEKLEIIMTKISEWFFKNPYPLYAYGFDLQRLLSDNMMDGGLNERDAKTSLKHRLDFVDSNRSELRACCQYLRSKHHLPECDERLADRDLRAAAGLPDFVYEARNSFVSGSTPSGIYDVLKTCCQDVLQPPFDFRRDDLNKDDLDDVILAYLELIRTYTVSPEGLLNPPRFTREEVYNIPYDPCKSAGYVFRRLEPTGLPEVDEPLHHLFERRVLSLAKGNTALVDMDELLGIFFELRDELAKGKLKYARSWFPLMVSKIAIKAEIRNHDVDPTKVRCFFIVAMLKYLMDKYIYGAPFQHMYGKGEVGIGFNRSCGEYDIEFARSMRDEYERVKVPTCVMDGDLHKMDQSMLAVFLNWIFMLPLYSYEASIGQLFPDGKYIPSDYEVLRAAMSFSADDMSVKLVKWVGADYRWIVGVMFSGAFGTSMGDTLYAIWAKTAFRYHGLRRLIAYLKSNGFSPDSPDPEKRAHYESEVHLYKTTSFARKYGDDLLDTLVRSQAWIVASDTPRTWEELLQDQNAVGDVIKPHYQSAWYKKNFNLNFKMSETRVFGASNPWMTHVDPRFDVMVREGPIYLKRRTVMLRVPPKNPGDKPEFVYAPWRQTNDYIAKSCNSTSLTSGTDCAYWIAKWRGLMIDTCGTNRMAYLYLRFLHDHFVKEWKGVNEYLDDALTAYIVTGKWPLGTGGDLPPLIKKVSVHFEMADLSALRAVPSREQILDKYMIDRSAIFDRRYKQEITRRSRDPLQIILNCTQRHVTGWTDPDGGR